MRSETNESENNELNSWKEISNYLGISERTAQKWEREKGLPVRRLPGARARVFADREELANWKSSTAEKIVPQDKYRVVGYFSAFTFSIALLLLGIGYLISVRHGPPALFRLDFNSLIVTDSSGNTLWRKTFPEPFGPGEYSPEKLIHHRRVLIEDIDPKDPGPEILFAYLPVKPERTEASLFCYSSAGEEKWHFTPGRQISDRKATYSANFVVESLLVTALEKDGDKNILVTSRHLYEHPNQFVILDMKGKVLSEYWHSGPLAMMDAADLDGNGIKEIALGGLNAGYDAAAAVILDPRDVFGASTQRAGDSTQIRGVGVAKERAVILFPRTCVSDMREKSEMVRSLEIAPGRIRVDVQVLENDAESLLVYHLDTNMKPSLAISDHYKILHREMEWRGDLKHALSAAEIDKLRIVRVLRSPDEKY